MRLLTALLASAAASAVPLPSPTSVLAAMASADSYWMTHNKPSDCGWEWGTYFAGETAHYNASGNKTLTTYSTTWAQANNWACGGPGGDSLDPNNFACGMTYHALYEIAPANYKLALLVTLQQAVATSPPYSWWWVDTFFMSLGTWYSYGRLLQEPALWNFAFAQYLDTTNGGPAGPSQPGLWNANYSLFYRDQTYINKTEPNGKPIFWGRGNGWAIASFVQALQQLPPAHPHAVEFRGKLVAMAAALKAQQGADGLWRASLADAAHYPNPETTGSACFTYGLAYGVNAGILPAAEYTPVVAAAWAGLASISLQPGGLVGWCQPVGGSPGPAQANSTSPFCVGQFLLAASQVLKLAQAVPRH